jgi:hypothetical protein
MNPAQFNNAQDPYSASAHNPPGNSRSPFIPSPSPGPWGVPPSASYPQPAVQSVSPGSSNNSAVPFEPFQQALPSLGGIRNQITNAITRKLKQKLETWGQQNASVYMPPAQATSSSRTPAYHSFRCEPLSRNGDQFRLVKFAPVPTPQSPITCTLHTFSLQEHPQYIALSYPVSVTESSRRFNKFEWIPCDGGYIEVYGGMLDILHRILDRYDPVYLWIDCFCIAPNDDDERTQQIGLMKHIYRNAKETVIWLETPEDNPARVNAAFESLRNSYIHFSDVKTREVFQGKLALIWASPFDRAALSQLLQAPYWSRVWMLQEATLSTYAVIYCCSNRITWSEFCQQMVCLMQIGFLTTLMEGYPNLKTLDSNDSWVGRHVAFLLIWIVLEKQRKEQISPTVQPPTKLKQVMYLTRWMNATDLRDRVYALLGLCSDAHEVAVIPAKEYSVATLYHQLALYFITPRSSSCNCESSVCPERELSILSEAGFRDWGHPALKDISEENKRVLQALPSWVPMWDYSRGNSIWQESHTAKYNAGGTTRPDIWHDPDTTLPRHLFINGIITTRIKYITRPCSSLFDIPSYMMLAVNLKPVNRMLHFGSWFQEARTQVQQTIAQSHTRMEDFCRTLCANVSHLEGGQLTLVPQRQPISNGRDLVRSFNDYMAVYEFVSTHVHLGYAYLATQMPTLRSHQQGGDKWHEIAVTRIARRAFFITEDERMGLGPGLAQVGDEVCVFGGAPVPMVLRPVAQGNDGQHQVVGDAYVHGLMNGEAFQLHPDRQNYVCLI